MAHKLDSSPKKKRRLEVLLLPGTEWAPIPSIGTAEKSQVFLLFFLPKRARSCFRHHVTGRRQAE